MTCGHCGATIADRAIVCYKCGTPTAVPAAPVRPARRRGGGTAVVVALLGVALAVVAVLEWPGRTGDTLAAVVVVVAAAVAVSIARRR